MDQVIDFQALPQVAAGRARGGRDTQQDALLCLHDPATDALLLVLADGMGGDGAGELAAEGVIEVARRLWELGLWREQPGAL
ncbi:MAG: serine/threonine-protein phosphatase, partial [Xanthomonadaceae bacterium]|nr:serine/threonine-protein phosphatase [Xanthomonadaceae bacterium]